MPSRHLDHNFAHIGLTANLKKELIMTQSKNITNKKKISNDKEDVIYGIHSVQMLFKKRPRDIKKVYLVESLKNKFSNLLRECAKRKIAYKIVDASALENISNSKHHEGICIYARPKKIISQQEFIKKLEKDECDSSIALLDSVQNPHNIGAIVRSMAHFGIKTLLVNDNEHLSLSGATYRVAEGGYEYVDIVKIDNIDKVSHQLNKYGFVIHGTSSHTDKKLYSYIFPEKTVIVVGNEVNGMSNKMKSRCNEMILIPGTGNVESLNVAQSLGLMLGELYRQVSTK